MNQTRKNLNLNFCDHDMNYECVKKFENWSFFLSFAHFQQSFCLAWLQTSDNQVQNYCDLDTGEPYPFVQKKNTFMDQSGGVAAAIHI